MAESVTAPGDSLHLAAKRGDEDAVKSFMEQPSRDLDAVDTIGWSALHYACDGGFLSIAKLLLDNGASVSSAVVGSGMTPLILATVKNSEAIVALLLRNGADVHAVDIDEFTALIHAAVKASLNVTKLLLSNGADISATSACGATALSLACWHGRSRLANFLIERGADVHWADLYPTCRRTLLHDATKNDMIETIQLLLDRGVAVDAVNYYGMTSLHLACGRHLNAVECLLQNGAQVSYTDPNGFTALHFAVDCYRSGYTNFMQVVELLFQYGADVNAKDEKGRTPLDFALLKSGTEAFKVFAKQLMALKAQGLFVSENNLKAISENEEAKSYGASCVAEIERMRNSTIGDSSVTIHDIFAKGANRVADFVANEGVHRILQSENYRAEFPIYASAIRGKFLQGTARRDLLVQSSDWLWAVVSESHALPYVCVERINRCLTNSDLSLQISREPSQQEAVGAPL